MARKRRKPMADINVVPYIDVMMVLLVIFMISTPLLTQGVKVELPQADDTESLDPKPSETVIVKVDVQGQYYLTIGTGKERSVNRDDLLGQIKNKLLEKPKLSVLVAGDKDVQYLYIMDVLALLSQSTLEVVVRAFAAQKDTLTPLLVSFFTTALNLLLAIRLSRPFQSGGLEHGGLALANGLAVAVEALIGLTILHFRWGGVGAGRILRDALRAALAAGLMGAAILAYQRLLNPGNLQLLFVGGLLGALVYLVSAQLFGLREIRDLPLAVLRGLVRRATG